MAMEKKEPQIRLSATAVEALKTAQSLQGRLGHSDGPHTFKYGWCRTDHKPGTEIRRRFRDHDYVFEEPYASRVNAMLDQLGLPHPTKGQVFRGTHHDLLFIDSHGVVLRIGPTEVNELINPAILQPLGWLQDDSAKIKLGNVDRPLTIAVYPGVEIYDHYLRLRKAAPREAGSVFNVLDQTQQSTADIDGNGNTGIIRVRDEHGITKAVRVVIDTDNEFNNVYGSALDERKRSIAQITAMVQQTGLGMDAALGASIAAMFSTVAAPWHRAQLVHQPLRHLFWKAFSSEHAGQSIADPANRDAFWHACGVAANKPVTLPTTMWKMEKDAQGNMTLGCKEVMMDVRLYKPWTGYEGDRPGREGFYQAADFVRRVAYALRRAGYMVQDMIKAVKDRLQPAAPVQGSVGITPPTQIKTSTQRADLAPTLRRPPEPRPSPPSSR